MNPDQHIAQHLFAPLSISRRDLPQLLVPWLHSPQVRRQRAALLISRVQLISILFGVLVPLWIIPDMLVFEPRQWLPLSGLRLCSAMTLLSLGWPRDLPQRWGVAMTLVVALMCIPLLFHVLASDVLASLPRDGLAGAMAGIYSLLPVIIIAGMSIFPLTILEGLILGIPLFAIIVALAPPEILESSWAGYAGMLWLLLMVLATSLACGISQLQYLIGLVYRASRDPLTGCLNRRAGEELFERSLTQAEEHEQPLSVLFIDLDRFKSINDQYGHDAGDQALKQLAEVLQTQLRRSDQVIRWGGEEFLLLLAHTDVSGMALVVERLRAHGLGLRPDGDPLTASMGGAERIVDRCQDWVSLVEKADARMYQAKQSGRNRAILPDGQCIA